MKSYTRNLFLVLMIVLVATAVSCSTNTPDETTNDNTDTSSSDLTAASSSGEGQTIITFAVNGWERGLYENRVADFEELNPDIKIELVSVDEIMGSPEGGTFLSSDSGDDSLLKLVQGADVISWYIQPGFVPDGLLLDLTPFMDSDSNFDAADYYPGLLEQFQWDGGTWGIPTNASYNLIFYDKDLFDKAGVDYPQAGWTWDDFLATAQELTLRDGDEVTQWGFTTQFIGPLDLVQAKVGPIFNTENDPPTARLEDPEVVAAFQWVADLHTKHEVAPYAKPPESEEDYAAYEEMYQLMEEGKIAMWPEFSESYTWRSEQRNLGVVPFPISESNEHSSPIVGFGGGVLAVSAGTAQPQAAWEWIKFLNQQDDGSGFVFGPGGPTSLPARKSVAEASGVWDDMDEELANALRYAVEHGFSPIYPPGGGEAIYMAANTIIDENKDAADVLAEAQQIFEQQVEEQASEQAKATPIPEFTVAEPPSAQIEEGVIVVRFVAAGGDPSTFRRAAEEFHELYPNIVVKVEEPNFYNEEFSLQAMIGDADCFQWWGALQSQEDLDQVLRIQPLLDADPDLSEDDFFLVVLDQFRDQGQVIGLPGEVQVSFMSYNKRLFDAAGVDYPEAGWTMDDFLTTAVALTQGDNEEEKIYGYVSDLYELGDLMTFAARQGAVFVDDNTEPAAASFLHPDTVAAIHWYANLTTEYGVKPTFDMSPGVSFGNPYEERQALIDNDRAAMWKNDPYSSVVYDESGQIISGDADDSHIGLVPYPTGKEGTSGFESVNGYYIAAQTEVRQAAWEWLKFITAQESLVQFGLPARISTAESEAFTQRIGPEKAAVMIDSVQNSTRAAMSDPFAAAGDWLAPAVAIGLQEAYGLIINEDYTAEEALQLVQEKADTYRQCIIENDLLDSQDYQKYESCLENAGLSWDNF
jgi:multiple sugar transport system substrate-binding protein